MISLAHGLGIGVVAEGIETEDQLTRLRQLGCDWGQGFFFARPLPPDDVARYLRSGLPHASAASGPGDIPTTIERPAKRAS